MLVNNICIHANYLDLTRLHGPLNWMWSSFEGNDFVNILRADITELTEN